MKYFLDTEFLEGNQKTFFGKTKPTIDLISIGIVGEDNREYYAISKDFNLKEAWNRYDLKYQITDSGRDKKYKKVYWIRENILKPLFYELSGKDINFHSIDHLFTFKNFKRLIEKYGKSNKLIASEVRDFVLETGMDYGIGPHQYTPIEFYTYYGDYDWVVFCWLFGKMIDLPTGFPMYSKDLKQTYDELQEKQYKGTLHGAPEYRHIIKEHRNYPQQQNEHNALSDAKWNKKLYEFLKTV